MIARLNHYIAAALPLTASISLDVINHTVAIAGGALGIAYLLWHWSREARRKQYIDARRRYRHRRRHR
ncbi:MAG: hypothetical protein LBK99_01520 [Opitutaceae bacterium]|jgi:hypothetical protein|nr:hypothetical protein [Opitutaceae bacterium]